MRLLIVLAAAVVGMGLPSLAQETTLPKEYTVEMWNKDPEDKKRKMVFSEDIITVAPGAAVTWLATDRGHNVQFIDGPDGVDLAKKSKVSNDVTITLNEPGVYVYVCTPHASTGMLGIVVVGAATAEAVEQASNAKVRGKSKKKLKTLLAGL
ncbi:plastocyanin/azurin family copper-binding protein [Planktomarina sp.]|nr:plastocyanin/azurin family copper-binding protein [Planktomarina sp.]